MILMSIMNAEVLTIQLLPQQFFFLHLHSHIPPPLPKKILAQKQEYQYLRRKHNTQVARNERLEKHTPFFSWRARRRVIHQELDRQSSSVENNSCMLLDNSG